MQDTKDALARLAELTKDVPVDKAYADQIYNEIMNEVYNDPEYKELVGEAEELARAQQQYSQILGDYGKVDERQKAAQAFDL